MNQKMNARSVRKSCFLLSVMVGPMLFGGCAKENRISFQQFVDMQQAQSEQGVQESQEEAPPPINVDQYLRPYTLGPGDVITITLTGMGEAAPIPPFQARVDRNGEIDAPIVGRLNVSKLELEDAEKVIHTAYVPAVYSQAVVHVATGDLKTTKVLVIGAVTTPGLIPLRQNERTLLHAIVGAGGASESASGETTLRRVRRQGAPEVFNLRDTGQLQQALAIASLDEGDIVEVQAARPNTIFVGGLVNRVGPQMYPSGSEITILQALAAAGGPRTDVVPLEGTLIRHNPDGSDIHVKLSLGRLARGQDANLALAAGDILWVPETFGTRVQEFINKNIFLRAGVSVTYNVSGLEFLNRASQQSGRSGGGNDLQNAFDPLGFLQRGTALQTLTSRPAPTP
ncbi:MAG: polysaccharide biosynthesis/export family protein [Planctomycetota bacterium]